MSNSPIHKLPGSSSLSGLIIAQGASASISRKVNLSAATDPGVGDDSGDGYDVGSLWVNTTLDKVFWCADAGVGAAVWKEVGSSETARAAETITDTNTFADGDIVRRSDTDWVKAQADSAGNAEVIGVIETASGADFTIVYSGKLNLPSHGFTVGAVLFLDPSTAGLLTETEPTSVGQVSKPVAIVWDADNILVVTFRGEVVANDDGVTSIEATGGVETVSGSAITTTGTVRASSIVNKQTGTTYTLLTGDRAKLVTFTNAASIAVTLPQASVTFPDGWFTTIQNRGAGTLTITPTTSTIDGAASIVLYTNQGVMIFSDGTNYFTNRGGAAIVTPWRTGDGKLTLQNSADTGWVLCDDGTIGSATSGGTTRANADTADLYALLWNNVSDTYAPVATGRGANAAADFAANKAISLTKQLGRAIAIAGAGSGLTSRALGETLGAETHALITAELASHTHQQVASTGSGTTANVVKQNPTGAGARTISADTVTGSGENEALVTVATGSGTAHNNMPPESFWNIMIKL